MTHPTLIVDNDAPADGLTIVERRVRDSGRYISKRITNLKAGEAWYDIGRELSELKAFAKKHGKADITRDGWLAIFKKKPCPIPFQRIRAEQLISIHEKIGVTGSDIKNLPASTQALIALARLPDSHRKQALELCGAATSSSDVARIAKQIGVPVKRKAKPKKPEPKFDDLYEGFRTALAKLPQKQLIEEYRNLAFDLGIGEILKQGQ